MRERKATARVVEDGGSTQLGTECIPMVDTGSRRTICEDGQKI